MPKKKVRRVYLYRTIIFVAFISLLPVAVIAILTNFSITKAINTELINLTANTIESVID